MPMSFVISFVGKDFPCRFLSSDRVEPLSLSLSRRRALQIPADAWLRFNLFHCSITHLVFTSDGRVICYGVGDVGHIPQERRSYV